MDLNMSVETSSVNQELAKLFVLRNMSFPLEHVFERTKLEAQKHPTDPAVVSVRNLWQQKGIKGFVEGSLANCTRRFTKELYQMPLTVFLNKFWKQHFPVKYNKDNLGTNLLTGFSVATIVQTGLTLPLDRVVIEKTTKEGYLPFFKKLKNHGVIKSISILYEGAQVTLMRHSLVWTNFFLANHFSIRLLKKIDPENQSPNLSRLAKVLLTSTGVVSTIYPIEFIRNRVLMNPEVLKEGTVNAIKTIYGRYGLRNMYRGVGIIWIHNNIQTLFYQALYEQMNKK
jgi:hypothetical protein